MPARDGDVDFCSWVDLHALREVRHAGTKVLRPLTADVICDENPREYNSNQRCKDNEIDTTVPKDQSIKL